MKRRGKNPNENPGVRPIERIELPEKISKFRIAAVIVLLAVGLGFLGYGVSRFFSQEDGWAEIQPVAESAESVAADLVFFYEFGASGRSVNTEHRELSALYTELCMDAYRIFTVDYPYDDVHNLYYLNAHIGETVSVDPTLYRAFEAMEKAGSRFLFAAPFYREYRNLFSDTEDASAENYDPYKSEEIAAYFAELAVFTASDEHISLTLHGDNNVTLAVSDAYRTFAAENGIDTFVDFYWARNAFALDYVADALIDKGYTYGSISSYDGFIRVLDKRDTSYTYNIYDIREMVEGDGEALLNVARIQYSGQTAFVTLRTFQMNEIEDTYYTYRSGERRYPYVDVNDGLCKAAKQSLISYQKGGFCADILLSMMPAYISDTWEENLLLQMADSGVHSIYVTDTTVYHTDPDAPLGYFYLDTQIEYKPATVASD